MFPHGEHSVPASPELALDAAIPSFILPDLLEPKIDSCLWDTATFWAAVPKAAIHKNCYTLRWEVEIWSAHNIIWMRNPATDTMLTQRSGHF